MERPIVSKWKKIRIRQLWGKGLSVGAIAKLVHVSKSSVYKYSDWKPVQLIDNYDFLPYHLKKRIAMEESYEK